MVWLFVRGVLIMSNKRTCAICKIKKPEVEMYKSGLKVYCGADCGAKLALKMYENENKKKDRAFKSETKRRKEDIKTLSEWTKEAQVIFNKYIRLRDVDLPCVSCGITNKELAEKAPKVGGYWDAGHYYSRGAFPELRFEPLNCHKQCKSCNGGSKKYARKTESVKEGYENELANRLSSRELKWLNGHHEPKRYRIDDVKEIIKLYSKLYKELLKDYEFRVVK